MCQFIIFLFLSPLLQRLAKYCLMSLASKKKGEGGREFCTRIPQQTLPGVTAVVLDLKDLPTTSKLFLSLACWNFLFSLTRYPLVVVDDPTCVISCAQFHETVCYHGTEFSSCSHYLLPSFIHIHAYIHLAKLVQ